ncbi:hypothetical protein ACO2Q3_12165 [Caulobacter sp. KR2-114]|uniref:hypothetical protein n=1 Tax=Caulobacter sp. KR2-114 TaxID=3400912 RepID=UPI003C024307
MSDGEPPWPWQAEPRRSPPTLAGNPEAAVAFGLADDLDGLMDLTRMIAAVIPDDIDCTATWTVPSRGRCVLAIDLPEWKLQQTFHRLPHGLEVEFDMLVLAATSRRRGFTKRLIRNLAIAYARLRVAYIKVLANHIDGALVWARLGAQPLDAEYERTRLLERLVNDHETLGIAVEYLEDLYRTIERTPAPSLMRQVAAFEGEKGEPLGEMLLRNHAWQAYWDPRDPDLYNHLKDVVG